AKEETTRSLEIRHLCGDGTYKWLNWTYTAHAQTRRIYAIARDLTELRRLRTELSNANENLQERVRKSTEAWERANELLQSLIDACPHAIIAVDKQKRVRIWNEAAVRIFGWKADEVIGGR